MVPGSSVHLALEVLARLGWLFPFFYGDRLLWYGHENHIPGITHLHYGNFIESDLVSGNSYKRKMVGLLERGLVEMVVSLLGLLLL